MRDLLPLAEHLHGAVPQIDAREVEADELRQSQSRRVEQLHYGPVARGQPPTCRHLQQPRHLVGIESLWQPSRRFRCAHALGGVGEHACQTAGAAAAPRACALAQQELEEAAQRRQPALDAARPEARRVLARGKAAHVLRVERAPVGEALAVAEPHQRREIACVGGVGMRGQAALGAQVAAEPGHPLESRGSHDCLNERGGLSA